MHSGSILSTRVFSPRRASAVLHDDDLQEYSRDNVEAIEVAPAAADAAQLSLQERLDFCDRSQKRN